MNNEKQPQIIPTHETEESRTWDTLLTGRQKVEQDMRNAREQHAKAQEQIAASRENDISVLKSMDALEAEAREKLAGHEEALERALKNIENVRKLVAECEEAYRSEQESYDALMQNSAELEEALDALELELKASRQ